jgi:hypothetical protein
MTKAARSFQTAGFVLPVAATAVSAIPAAPNPITRADASRHWCPGRKAASVL